MIGLATGGKWSRQWRQRKLVRYVRPPKRYKWHCEKCGKYAWARVKVKRINRYGTEYFYWRYAHPDARKVRKGGLRYCFVPWKEENHS